MQRRFTKQLNGLCNTSYSERLKILSADTLKIRRTKLDLKLYFSIINNFTVIPCDDFVELESNVIRDNVKCLKMCLFKNNLEPYLFKNRLIHVWNLLPDVVINSPCINGFVINLNSVDIVVLLAPTNRYIV